MLSLQANPAYNPYIPSPHVPVENIEYNEMSAFNSRTPSPYEGEGKGEGDERGNLGLA